MSPGLRVQRALMRLSNVKAELTQEQLKHRREWQAAYRAKNLERVREYSRQWYRRNKAKCSRWSKQKFANNPEKHRALVRRNYLNRTFGQGGAAYYERRFAEQNGRCAICGELQRAGKWGRLHQDHDTGCCPYDRSEGRKATILRTCGKCRRGLLCNNCNAALAGIERPGWLRKALRYLRQWKQHGKRHQTAAFLDLLVELKRQLNKQRR
jgi:hypothetical protein